MGQEVKNLIADALAFVRKDGVHVVGVYLAVLGTLVGSHTQDASVSSLLALIPAAALAVLKQFPAAENALAPIAALENELKAVSAPADPNSKPAAK